MRGDKRSKLLDLVYNLFFFDCNWWAERHILALARTVIPNSA